MVPQTAPRDRAALVLLTNNRAFGLPVATGRGLKTRRRQQREIAEALEHYRTEHV